MDRSLSALIWKHSKRDQLVLLLVTLLTFPFLYATLELPKRIINDAIGAEDPMVMAFGYQFSQIQFLSALCFGYLAAVLAHQRRLAFQVGGLHCPLGAAVRYPFQNLQKEVFYEVSQ